MRKKALQPGDAETAKRWLSHYMNWHLIENDGSTVIQAIDIEQRYRVSFWDALIIQAANTVDANLLHSEDLNHGQQYGNVRVANPFI